MKILSLKSVNPSECMSAAEPSSLISDCIAGDERAIEAFVRRYEAGVFRLALSIVDDPLEAREIAQETFIAALNALRTYTEKSTLRAWLYRIAYNRSQSHLRRRRVMARLRAALSGLLQLSEQPARTPEETVIADEKEAAVWRSLQKLDERHRVVVILRYFHELPAADIARILSISEGTVHSRLHTARERLRAELAPFRGE